MDCGPRFNVGDVLVDQTLVFESARLFDGAPTGHQFKEWLERSRGKYPQTLIGAYDVAPTNIERLLNLSILTDALALQPQAYVLSAELPFDQEPLRLREVLLNQGILRTIDASLYAQEIRDDILCELRTAIEKAPEHIRGHSEFFEKALRESLAVFQQARIPETYHPGIANALHEGLARCYEGDIEDRRLNSARLKLASDPSETFGLLLLVGIQGIPGISSAAHIGSISELRTLVYWGLSRRAGLAFYPSARRVAHIELLYGKIHRGLTQEVYSRVAQAFGVSVEKIYSHETSPPLHIPPTLTVFLDLLRDLGDLEKAVDAFRSEFAPIREQLHGLEQELYNADTLGEREEIMLKYRRAFDAMSIKYERYGLTEDAKVERVVSWAPEMVGTLANPADLSKYSAKVLAQPLEWIREWWRLRPLRRVLDIKKRLASISRYESLVGDTLGLEFRNQENEFFRARYQRYLDLFSAKQTTEE